MDSWSRDSLKCGVGGPGSHLACIIQRLYSGRSSGRGRVTSEGQEWPVPMGESSSGDEQREKALWRTVEWSRGPNRKRYLEDREGGHPRAIFFQFLHPIPCDELQVFCVGRKEKSRVGKEGRGKKWRSQGATSGEWASIYQETGLRGMFLDSMDYLLCRSCNFSASDSSYRTLHSLRRMQETISAKEQIIKCRTTMWN